ncbi:MAG: dihydroxyacetone kinase subunit L [Spirochaetaceae bacterium]|nr:MAG: dihydroxyacetone kinase subunit L [Spirochaetaceae bacterium]
MLTLDQVLAWLNALDDVYARNKARLTDLDSAIGDADHGINLARGFSAVAAALAQQPPEDIAAALKTASLTLIRTVGGAAGPLYGTFFLRASTVSAGKTALSAADVVAVIEAGVGGLLQRGKAEREDKTMVDAWLPALEAIQKAHAEGASIAEMMRQATAAAEAGMRATIPLIARKGRASYLGERSIGHQDPGATSTYLMLQAAADTWN